MIASTAVDQTAHVSWEIYGGVTGIVFLIALIIIAIKVVNTPKTKRG